MIARREGRWVGGRAGDQFILGVWNENFYWFCLFLLLNKKIIHGMVFMEHNYSGVGLDDIDLKMLRLLQRQGRMSNAELAEHVCLSPPPCWKRLKRLESLGVIRGYQAVLDKRMLGMGLTVFVSVLLESHSEETCRRFEQAVLDMPEVVACHNISGQHDYLLHVVTRDMDSYSHFALRQLRKVAGVKEMQSTFSLRDVKETAAMLPA
ncbi:transcription regulator AsnC [Bordetella trematum]|uniref:Transcription regulator AsnC n=2 Tax=Bordetella trematum TaxID=123899 RepID=A0A157Q9A4_9BORD|nr:transcription regulator AsnC [Bordetella trematum]SAI66124.1 transcription regulator AsnC [Bordetella trematum]SUV96749.1 transcription regulator AsnC [Bordetella trematum]